MFILFPAPLITRLPRESGLMPLHSVMVLEYRIVVEGLTSIVLYLHGVVDIVVDSCYRSEDTSDCYSS